MNNASSGTSFSPGAVSSRLAQDLPGWTCSDGFIQRSYATTGWKATLMVVNAVGYLCEAGWHHPDLEVSYNKLTVKLKSHDVDAITDRDFELAGKIEQLVGWAPTDRTGALTGPPGSQRILKD